MIRFGALLVLVGSFGLIPLEGAAPPAQTPGEEVDPEKRMMEIRKEIAGLQARLDRLRAEAGKLEPPPETPLKRIAAPDASGAGLLGVVRDLRFSPDASG